MEKIQLKLTEAVSLEEENKKLKEKAHKYEDAASKVLEIMVKLQARENMEHKLESELEKGLKMTAEKKLQGLKDQQA